MTDLLITAAEVLETAFPSNEYVPEGMIVPARIETAQLGFLRPVFGKLYDKLGEEPYAAFCRTYIKPALAYYVRYLMVDEQCAAIGAAGVRQNKSAYTAAQAGAQRCRHAAGQGDRLRGKQSGDVPGIRPERKYPPPGLDKRRIHSVKTPHMKQMIGTISSVAALFAPVQPLVCCALAFVCVDFATGVAASYKRAGRMKRPWAFESDKAWRTVYKLVFVTVGIAMTWLIDTCILPFAGLRLANLFTGFVCGVELWSYLENAAEISEHPLFRKLKKYMKQELEKNSL